MNMQFVTMICGINVTLKKAASCLGVISLLLAISAHAQRLTPLNSVESGKLSSVGTVTVVEY